MEFHADISKSQVAFRFTLYAALYAALRGNFVKLTWDFNVNRLTTNANGTETYKHLVLNTLGGP